MSSERLVYITGTDIAECPVSYITPQNLQLARMFLEGERVREFTGAHPFGADMRKWEARFYDACQLIAIEETRVKDAAEKAAQS